MAAACVGGAGEACCGVADGVDSDALGLRDERARRPEWLRIRRRRRRRRQQDSAWISSRTASKTPPPSPAAPWSARLSEYPLPFARAQASTAYRGALAGTALTVRGTHNARQRCRRVLPYELNGCACAAGALPWPSRGACVCGLRVLARCCDCPDRRLQERRYAHRAGSETLSPPTG